MLTHATDIDEEFKQLKMLEKDKRKIFIYIHKTLNYVSGNSKQQYIGTVEEDD